MIDILEIPVKNGTLIVEGYYEVEGDGYNSPVIESFDARKVELELFSGHRRDVTQRMNNTEGFEQQCLETFRKQYE